MGRLTGVVRDVTPTGVTALGGAGGAVGALLGTRRQLAEDRAFADEQRRREGLFKLGVQRLRGEIEYQQQRRDREAADLRDQSDAARLELQSLGLSHDLDTLGPQVRAFLDEATNRAATMTPLAGRRVVAAASGMVAAAEQQRFRQQVQDAVHNSIATGYWQQIASDLAALGSGGIDVTGDGRPDLDVATIDQLGEGFAAMLEDPDADPAQVMQDFETATRALEGERARLNRRVATFNRLRGRVDSAFVDQTSFGQTGQLTGVPTNRSQLLPLQLHSEIDSLLEQYRRGELGDGERTEYELEQSVDALLRRKRRIPLPAGHPLGDAIEMDAAAADTIRPDDLYQMLGLRARTTTQRREDRVYDAYERASDIVGKAVTAGRLSPDETQQLLDQVAQRIENLAHPEDAIDFGFARSSGPLAQKAAPQKQGGGAFTWNEYPDKGQWLLDGLAERIREAVQGGAKPAAAFADAFKFFNLDPKSLPNDLKASLLRALGL